MIVDLARAKRAIVYVSQLSFLHYYSILMETLHHINLRENSIKLPILYLILQKTTLFNFFFKQLPYVILLFAKEYLLTDRLVLTGSTNVDYHVRRTCPII